MARTKEYMKTFELSKSDVEDIIIYNTNIEEYFKGGSESKLKTGLSGVAKAVFTLFTNVNTYTAVTGLIIQTFTNIIAEEKKAYQGSAGNGRIAMTGLLEIMKKHNYKKAIIKAGVLEFVDDNWSMMTSRTYEVVSLDGIKP